jgi:ornithine carbamoyltransferase
MKRDLLALRDVGGAGVLELLAETAVYDRLRGTADHPRPLAGKCVALLFEKSSTRTRVALEVATVELGGHPMVITAAGSQVARGEPTEDTARVFGRTVAAVAYRTGPSSRIEAMARACSAPVINALSDDAHPLQVLADLYTVKVARGRLDGLRYAWVGDASNVARSWIEAAGLLGLDLTVASPEGFGPPEAEVAAACAAGGKVTVISDAAAAARGADVLMTDVWVSMGQEATASARIAALTSYRLTRALVDSASPEVVVMHCLPAHRGEEIDADVIDGPRSFVWEQVSARLHTSKAVLAWVMGSAPQEAGCAQRDR